MTSYAYKVLSQRLVEVTTERDRARDLAVALEQELRATREELEKRGLTLAWQGES